MSVLGTYSILNWPSDLLINTSSDYVMLFLLTCYPRENLPSQWKESNVSSNCVWCSSGVVFYAPDKVLFSTASHMTALEEDCSPYPR